MNQESSKTIEMEDKLNDLSLIIKLNPREDLREEIWGKICAQRSKVSPRWAMGIAAALVVIIGLELAIGIQKTTAQKNKPLELMLSSQNNGLYE
jgi:hypothetical protein